MTTGADSVELEELLDALRRAANDARSAVGGLRMDTVLRIRHLMACLERQVEIVGLICRALPVTFKAEHPEIGWQHFIRLQERLATELPGPMAHEIWLAVDVDFYALIRCIDAALGHDHMIELVLEDSWHPDYTSP
jgi:uncharacterized protein with HEPN domain